MNSVQYHHEGLTQLKNIRFAQDGTPIKSDHGNVDVSNIKVSFCLTLPLFLTCKVWQRHNYSLEDIQTTLEFFSSHHLWQRALLLDIHPSVSAIKVSFATAEAMVFGSKAIAIKKIKHALRSRSGPFPQVSVLDKTRMDHIPPLPLYQVSNQKIEQLRTLLPPANTMLLRTIFYACYIKWKDILIVPVWEEQDAIYCVRIISKALFSQTQRARDISLSTRPLDIRIGEEDYCGLEEAMFFVANQPL